MVQLLLGNTVPYIKGSLNLTVLGLKDFLGLTDLAL